MDLVIATTNPHKFRELRALLNKRLKGKFDFYSLNDFSSYSPPVEEGASFKENAELKALEAAKQLQKWVVADDSGLIVPALKGAPGIHSAYYAGEKATDKENRQKLLKEMSGLEGLQRCAYFECYLALASPEKILTSVRGICEGIIAEKEKGRNGFGYDPLFSKHDYNQTFAEVDESVKNLISHRAKACEKLLIFLESRCEATV